MQPDGGAVLPRVLDIQPFVAAREPEVCAASRVAAQKSATQPTPAERLRTIYTSSVAGVAPSRVTPETGAVRCLARHAHRCVGSRRRLSRMSSCHGAPRRSRGTCGVARPATTATATAADPTSTRLRRRTCSLCRHVLCTAFAARDYRKEYLSRRTRAMRPSVGALPWNCRFPTPARMLLHTGRQCGSAARVESGAAAPWTPARRGGSQLRSRPCRDCRRRSPAEAGDSRLARQALQNDRQVHAQPAV